MFVWEGDDWGRFVAALDIPLQNRLLDTWDEAMDKKLGAGIWKLERVGFTALFSWNRQPDRTWLNEEPSKDRRMWRHYEGIDSEDGSISGDSDSNWGGNSDSD